MYLIFDIFLQIFIFSLRGLNYFLKFLPITNDKINYVSRKVQKIFFFQPSYANVTYQILHNNIQYETLFFKVAKDFPF